MTDHLISRILSHLPGAQSHQYGDHQAGEHARDPPSTNVARGPDLEPARPPGSKASRLNARVTPVIAAITRPLRSSPDLVTMSVLVAALSIPPAHPTARAPTTSEAVAAEITGDAPAGVPSKESHNSAQVTACSLGFSG